MGWFDILKAGTGKFDLGAANRLANEVFGEGTTGFELTSLFPNIGGNNMRERISSFAKNVIVNKIPNESDVKFVERQYERYLTKLNKLEEILNNTTDFERERQIESKIKRLKIQNAEIIKERGEYELVNNPEKLIRLAEVYGIDLKEPTELTMLMTALELEGVRPIPGIVKVSQQYGMSQPSQITQEIDSAKILESMRNVAQSFKYMGKKKPIAQDIMDELDISPQKWDYRYDEMLQEANKIFNEPTMTQQEFLDRIRD
jgi:hypothetical protein